MSTAAPLQPWLRDEVLAGDWMLGVVWTLLTLVRTCSLTKHKVRNKLFKISQYPLSFWGGDLGDWWNIIYKLCNFQSNHLLIFIIRFIVDEFHKPLIENFISRYSDGLRTGWQGFISRRWQEICSPLSLFWKNRSRFIKWPCCLCACVSVYPPNKRESGARRDGVARQQLSKHFPGATNTHTTRENCRTQCFFCDPCRVSNTEYIMKIKYAIISSQNFLFTFSHRPDRPWGQSSLLTNGYKELFPRE
jgi:hypothetical protein